jgi:8-oxo-dGTP pyrophosphatase MutT (NUDIX family)
MATAIVAAVPTQVHDDTPEPGSTVYRDTARVLPVNAGRVLLLQGRDPAQPAADPFWFTVGGAIEPPETARAAAIRELGEETAIIATEQQLGSPFARATARFTWRGYDVVQTQIFFALAVASKAVSLDGLDDWERHTTEAFGWWTPDEVRALCCRGDAGAGRHHAPRDPLSRAATPIR